MLPLREDGDTGYLVLQHTSGNVILSAFLRAREVLFLSRSLSRSANPNCQLPDASDFHDSE